MIRLAFVSMLAMVPFGAGANQLFVSPKGSDRGQCDSQKKPIRSSGNGSIAFASRQFAIMDVSNARIGQLAGGTVMSAQEMSKINCLSGVVLYGSVGHVAQAGGMSTISLNCAFRFENTPQINAIAVAVQKSLILADSASWEAAFFGQKYIVAR